VRLVTEDDRILDVTGETPTEALARALRDLRTSAGSQSFRALARATNYAPSTLADATSGKRLPTRPVVEAFAKACGADPDEWAERWRRAAGVGMIGEAAGRPEPPPEPRPRRRPTWQVAAAVAVAVVATATASSLITHSVDSGGSSGVTVPATTPALNQLPADGQDPAAAGCGNDVTVLGRKTTSFGGEQGVLELKYSPHCEAGWARFYLLPNSQPLLAEVRLTASDGRAAAFTYMAEGSMPVYTDLLHPDGGCLVAEAVLHPANQAPVVISTPCMRAG
jgi:transcriptional regulator with XRE-family HTH domain